ncbi:MAG: undecaprenyldiphospho-muramoylpentapeptide beta-N-acetylglucosaminyltransferase [Calditrichaeota bacterium]|nr:undecaprenyldiphospho-muramoylpentapeptide beta-N-acetylglucosaminyltransferase [Calditrichota bacterium]
MAKHRYRVLIAGGGTGGHVYPALAIIDGLREKGSFEFLYVGGNGGIETRIVPPREIPLEAIWISGFARSLSLKNLLFPIKLAVSMVQSWQIIRKFRPDVAVGTGGYVSGPVMYVAARRGVPVLIQEQDVYPGITTRLLARYARRICLSFAAAQEHLSPHRAKLTVTGNPVRAGLAGANRVAAREKWQLQADKMTLLIFGGSQGARAINRAMAAILPEILAESELQVLWQTGSSQYQDVCDRYPEPPDTVKIVPYIDDMSEAYAAADLIVSRAGANSLAELAVVGRPAILVPYPYAAGDHQAHNSRMVEAQGAALMVEEGDGWEQKLSEALRRLIADGDLRASQEKAWQALARPQATADIVAEIIKLIANSTLRP